MTHEQFVMWLHGYFEISNPKTIGEKETQIIKDHLDLFFKKETPDRLKIDIVADPKMPPDEIKIVPQKHGLLCSCPICEAGRIMIRKTCSKCGMQSCMCHLYDPSKLVVTC